MRLMSLLDKTVKGPTLINMQPPWYELHVCNITKHNDPLYDIIMTSPNGHGDLCIIQYDLVIYALSIGMTCTLCCSAFPQHPTQNAATDMT